MSHQTEIIFFHHRIFDTQTIPLYHATTRSIAAFKRGFLQKHYQGRFFKEIAGILKMNGLMLIVEPPLHVSKKAFNQTIKKAQGAGLTAGRGPRVFLSKTVILIKG